MERAFEIVPASEIYSTTGIQFLPINTLYQVLADARDAELGDTALLLPIADCFSYRFSGRRTAEVSRASTTQLTDVNTRQFAFAIEEVRIGRISVARDRGSGNTPRAGPKNR